MASTLEDIAELFATKTTNLKRCVEIRSAGSSSTCISVLKSIENELKEIEAALDSLQADVKKEKLLLEQGEVRTYTRFLEEVKEKAMKEAAVKFRERLEHTSSNLPPHLPGFEKKVQRPSKEKDEPLKESVQNPRKTKRVKDISTADNGSRFPKLAYLTVEEFEEIPKYIKGRISYDQVNNAIDEIHKVIIAKYKILRLPRSAMGEPVMKKYKAFKEAETPETEGEYFFVDDDLKTYSQLKMDSTGKAILIMLRHCGRLREVRSKKLLRYVLKL